MSFGILITGCAAIKEGAKGFAGVSTQALEAGRKGAVIKTFNYDYPGCYNKTLDILKNTGSYIYAQDSKKRMIALYVSREDTTSVGIFFEELDGPRTRVEVSSPSTSAKDFIAKNLFSALEKPLQPIQQQ